MRRCRGRHCPCCRCRRCRRHRSVALGDILVKVLLPNSVWIIWPLLGMWSAYTIITTDSYAVMTTGLK
jgi:hypothetical protein